MSNISSALIAFGRLPTIFKQVEKKTAEVDEELREIPEPSTENPVIVLGGRLSALAVDIKDYLDGGRDRNDFLEKW
jgi:hypothetical protein